MKCKVSFLLILFISLSSQIYGQELELPRKSPKASVSFTVGLTNVEINYSSPSVNDRKIWGKLVPYGKIWRAGANEATTIEFSTEVNVEGEKLEAGKYAFFLIPDEDEWIAIFNKNYDQWGTYQYDESQDVARINVIPRFTDANQERLNFSISDQSPEQGYIKFAWGTARLYLR